MRNLIRGFADARNSASFASKMRRRRFEFFFRLLQQTPKPIRILDVGGTQRFWQVMGYESDPEISVHLLNLKAQTVLEPGFSSSAGDATNLGQFDDLEFDIVFSNSVIEHVGDFSQQRKMAQEVQRVGKQYFIQTPNYYFPIEPHFLFPGFQWLPVSVRTTLVQRFQLGWMPKAPDKHKARETVEGIRLLTEKELTILFPNAEIYEEKLWGLTKSLVAYSGWE